MTGGRIKTIFLLLYMGFATWRVFYNVFLEENEFTGAQIGIINALFQSTIFLIVPLWGFIADKKGIRLTLGWVCLVTAIVILFLGKIQAFGFVLFYILLLSVFHHPLGPLTDALAVQFSKTTNLYNYGKLRFWGSFGWAIASILGGFLFIHIAVDYIFPVSAVFFLSVIIFLKVPRKRTVIYKSNFQPFDLRYLLRNKQLFIFIIILIIYGLTCAPVYSYINLYFTELKASNRIIGFAYAVQAFSELHFFIIGERLMRRFGSRRIIIISLIVMVIRMFLYGLFPSVPLGLLLGILQGITLSFFLVGVVEYIHHLLPAGRFAIAQSIIWGFYFGMGQTIGNLIIGYLKDITGMVNVMWIFGILTFSVLIAIVVHFYLRSGKIKTEGNNGQ
ncbi:MAG: MFS transporter [Bacteroidales bacterium]|nr:MAG: MFS transporter [Bacteroidales bacterium]